MSQEKSIVTDSQSNSVVTTFLDDLNVPPISVFTTAQDCFVIENAPNNGDDTPDNEDDAPNQSTYSTALFECLEKHPKSLKEIKKIRVKYREHKSKRSSIVSRLREKSSEDSDIQQTQKKQKCFMTTNKEIKSLPASYFKMNQNYFTNSVLECEVHLKHQFCETQKHSPSSNNSSKHKILEETAQIINSILPKEASETIENICNKTTIPQNKERKKNSEMMNKIKKADSLKNSIDFVIAKKDLTRRVKKGISFKTTSSSGNFCVGDILKDHMSRKRSLSSNARSLSSNAGKTTLSTICCDIINSAADKKLSYLKQQDSCTSIDTTDTVNSKQHSVNPSGTATSSKTLPFQSLSSKVNLPLLFLTASNISTSLTSSTVTKSVMLSSISLATTNTVMSYVISPKATETTISPLISSPASKKITLPLISTVTCDNAMPPLILLKSNEFMALPLNSSLSANITFNSNFYMQPCLTISSANAETFVLPKNSHVGLFNPNPITMKSFNTDPIIIESFNTDTANSNKMAISASYWNIQNNAINKSKNLVLKNDCTTSENTCTTSENNWTTSENTFTTSENTCTTSENTCTTSENTCTTSENTCTTLENTCTTSENTCTTSENTCTPSENTCTTSENTCTTSEKKQERLTVLDTFNNLEMNLSASHDHQYEKKCFNYPLIIQPIDLSKCISHATKKNLARNNCVSPENQIKLPIIGETLNSNIIATKFDEHITSTNKHVIEEKHFTCAKVAATNSIARSAFEQLLSTQDNKINTSHVPLKEVSMVKEESKIKVNFNQDKLFSNIRNVLTKYCQIPSSKDISKNNLPKLSAATCETISSVTTSATCNTMILPETSYGTYGINILYTTQSKTSETMVLSSKLQTSRLSTASNSFINSFAKSESSDDTTLPKSSFFEGLNNNAIFFNDLNTGAFKSTNTTGSCSNIQKHAVNKNSLLYQNALLYPQPCTLQTSCGVVSISYKRNKTNEAFNKLRANHIGVLSELQCDLMTVKSTAVSSKLQSDYITAKSIAVSKKLQARYIPIRPMIMSTKPQSDQNAVKPVVALNIPQSFFNSVKPTGGSSKLQSDKNMVKPAVASNILQSCLSSVKPRGVLSKLQSDQIAVKPIGILSTLQSELNPVKSIAVSSRLQSELNPVKSIAVSSRLQSDFNPVKLTTVFQPGYTIASSTAVSSKLQSHYIQIRPMVASTKLQSDQNTVKRVVASIILQSKLNPVKPKGVSSELQSDLITVKPIVALSIFQSDLDQVKSIGVSNKLQSDQITVKPIAVSSILKSDLIAIKPKIVLQSNYNVSRSTAVSSKLQSRYIQIKPVVASAKLQSDQNKVKHLFVSSILQSDLNPVKPKDVSSSLESDQITIKPATVSGILQSELYPLKPKGVLSNLKSDQVTLKAVAVSNYLQSDLNPVKSNGESIKPQSDLITIKPKMMFQSDYNIARSTVLSKSQSRYIPIRPMVASAKTQSDQISIKPIVVSNTFQSELFTVKHSSSILEKYQPKNMHITKNDKEYCIASGTNEKSLDVKNNVMPISNILSSVLPSNAKFCIDKKLNVLPVIMAKSDSHVIMAKNDSQVLMAKNSLPFIMKQSAPSAIIAQNVLPVIMEHNVPPAKPVLKDKLSLNQKSNISSAMSSPAGNLNDKTNTLHVRIPPLKDTTDFYEVNCQEPIKDSSILNKTNSCFLPVTSVLSISSSSNTSFNQKSNVFPSIIALKTEVPIVPPVRVSANYKLCPKLSLSSSTLLSSNIDSNKSKLPIRVILRNISPVKMAPKCKKQKEPLSLTSNQNLCKKLTSPVKLLQIIPKPIFPSINLSSSSYLHLKTVNPTNQIKNNFLPNSGISSFTSSSNPNLNLDKKSGFSAILMAPYVPPVILAPLNVSCLKQKSNVLPVIASSASTQSLISSLSVKLSLQDSCRDLVCLPIKSNSELANDKSSVPLGSSKTCTVSVPITSDSLSKTSTGVSVSSNNLGTQGCYTFTSCALDSTIDVTSNSLTNDRMAGNYIPAVFLGEQDKIYRLIGNKRKKCCFLPNSQEASQTISFLSLIGLESCVQELCYYKSKYSQFPLYPDTGFDITKKKKNLSDNLNFSEPTSNLGQIASLNYNRTSSLKSKLISSLKNNDCPVFNDSETFLLNDDRISSLQDYRTPLLKNIPTSSFKHQISDLIDERTSLFEHQTSKLTNERTVLFKDEQVAMLDASTLSFKDKTISILKDNRTPVLNENRLPSFEDNRSTIEKRTSLRAKRISLLKETLLTDKRTSLRTKGISSLKDNRSSILKSKQTSLRAKRISLLKDNLTPLSKDKQTFSREKPKSSRLIKNKQFLSDISFLKDDHNPFLEDKLSKANDLNKDPDKENVHNKTYSSIDEYNFSLCQLSSIDKPGVKNSVTLLDRPPENVESLINVKSDPGEFDKPSSFESFGIFNKVKEEEDSWATNFSQTDVVPSEDLIKHETTQEYTNNSSNSLDHSVLNDNQVFDKNLRKRKAVPYSYSLLGHTKKSFVKESSSNILKKYSSFNLSPRVVIEKLGRV